MRISKKGIDMIKRFEGFRSKAYKDVAGVWTIGYGHTGIEVHSGITISEEVAEQVLMQELEWFERYVSAYDSTYHWNQNEFDAMVSFAFNIGNINQLTADGTRSKQKISEKMLEYTHAGGKFVEGLYKRRLDECALFNTHVTGWNKAPFGRWKYNELKDCWANINNRRYYFDKDGYAVTGLQQLEDGGTYYFKEWGELECALCVTDNGGVLSPMYIKED